MAATDSWEAETMSAQATSQGTPDLYVIHGPDGLRQHAGKSLGVSRWVTIDQGMVTAFAELLSTASLPLTTTPTRR